jgi:hypothetical protein
MSLALILFPPLLALPTWAIALVSHLRRRLAFARFYTLGGVGDTVVVIVPQGGVGLLSPSVNRFFRQGSLPYERHDEVYP